MRIQAIRVNNSGVVFYYIKGNGTTHQDSDIGRVGGAAGKIKIAQKTIGLEWGKLSFDYDGKQHVPTATATGLVDGDTCDVTVETPQTEVGEGYPAKATELSNPNYTLPTDNTICERTFSIISVTEGACGDNATWSLDEDGVLTVSGEGEIYFDNALPFDTKNVKTLEIEAGITSIGSCTFSNYSSLQKIVLPDTLETIGYRAFYGCINLKKIVLPNSLKWICNEAFNSTGLKEVTIHALVEEIGNKALGYTDDEKISDFTAVVHADTEGERYCNENNIDITIAGHKADAIDFVWSGNGKNCKAEFYCPECNKDYAKKCTVTSKVVEAATCTREGKTTYTATYGDYSDSMSIRDIEMIDHEWGEEYVIDVHSTCTKPGEKSIHCKHCGAIKPESEVVINPAHTYGSFIIAPTCTQSGYTLHVCGVCGNSYSDAETEPKGHSFGEWREIEEADCTSEGAEQRKCNDCGYTETRGINKKDHEWEDEYTVDKKATCTTDGSKSIHCKHCEATKWNDSIKATGHKFGEWIETELVTCTKDGRAERICEDCGEIENITLKAFGHSWATEYAVDEEPTCLTAGTESIHCLRCDMMQPDTIKEIPKTEEHKWNDGEITTPATETTDGVKTYTCTICQATKTEKIDKTGGSISGGNEYSGGGSVTAPEENPEPSEKTKETETIISRM